MWDCVAIALISVNDFPLYKNKENGKGLLWLMTKYILLEALFFKQ